MAAGKCPASRARNSGDQSFGVPKEELTGDLGSGGQ